MTQKIARGSIKLGLVLISVKRILFHRMKMRVSEISTIIILNILLTLHNRKIFKIGFWCTEDKLKKASKCEEKQRNSNGGF